MAAIGDKIIILPKWGEGLFFKAGDDAVLTRIDEDGDWWADFGHFTDRCVGVEGVCFAVIEKATLSEVTQLQARVAELEAALADEREVHVSVSSASDDELTKTRDALRRLEVSANSVAYCYRHRPENFAGALLALEDDAAFAREVSGDQP